jgi:hypothetical protein
VKNELSIILDSRLEGVVRKFYTSNSLLYRGLQREKSKENRVGMGFWGRELSRSRGCIRPERCAKESGGPGATELVRKFTFYRGRTGGALIAAKKPLKCCYD